MSKQPKALELASRLDAMSDSMDMGRPAVNDDRRQAAAELRRLHSLNAELVDALKFYADETRYHGPNVRLDAEDAWSERVGLTAYRLDVTRDRGVIASLAIAKAEAQQ